MATRAGLVQGIHTHRGVQVLPIEEADLSLAGASGPRGSFITSVHLHSLTSILCDRPGQGRKAPVPWPVLLAAEHRLCFLHVGS